MRKITFWTIFSLSLISWASSQDDVPENTDPRREIQTVPYVDLERYMGLWYELYRFPNSFEEGCFNVTANYKLENKRVSVKNSCTKKNGKVKVANGTAFIVNKETNAELKVSFVPILRRWGFFAGDYNILALDDEYQYALVGSKNREFLWILSRTKNLSELIISELELIAKDQGYDISKFIKTPQIK